MRMLATAAFLALLLAAPTVPAAAADPEAAGGGSCPFFQVFLAPPFLCVYTHCIPSERPDSTVCLPL